MPKYTPENDRMRWKKNALRHGYISYRVAECADAAYGSALAIEAGGVRQYVRLLEKSLVRAEAKTGRFLWRYDVSAKTAK
jgi:hypothetical protein